MSGVRCIVAGAGEGGKSNMYVEFNFARIFRLQSKRWCGAAALGMLIDRLRKRRLEVKHAAYYG